MPEQCRHPTTLRPATQQKNRALAGPSCSLEVAGEDRGFGDVVTEVVGVAEFNAFAMKLPKTVGLMTQLRTVSPQICLKSSRADVFRHTFRAS
jgi:hypothetical protein